MLGSDTYNLEEYFVGVWGGIIRFRGWQYGDEEFITFMI